MPVWSGVFVTVTAGFCHELPGAGRIFRAVWRTESMMSALKMLRSSTINNLCEGISCSRWCLAGTCGDSI